MDLVAEWRIVGVVTEARELTSQKNEKWRGYVCKVATFGLLAELQLTPELYKGVGVGLQAEFRGRFELNNNVPRLMTESVRPIGKSGGAA